MTDENDQEEPITRLAQLVRSKAPQRTVSSVLASAIREQILSGALSPGARIVESEFAKTYGTSRTTVREALRELIAEDLVEVAKHRSPTVKFLDRQMVFDILSVRAVLEGYAAGLAAAEVGASQAHSDWLNNQFDLWSNPDQFETYDDFAQANTALHAGIRRMANKAVLEKQIVSLAIPGYQKAIAPLPNKRAMTNSAKQHCDIIAVLRDGNVARSEALMRAHVEAARARLDVHFNSIDERNKALSAIPL